MSHSPIPPSPEGVPGAVTDPSRIAAEELTFTGAGGTQINGYLARPVNLSSAHPTDSNPDRGGRAPGLIVIHEAGGLGEHIRDVTRRFANAGYVALGVDLYTREGGPPPMDDLQALMARLFSMSDAVVLGDLEGAADHLRARPDVTGKVGCIGFCMGGRFTLLFACASERLDAAVDCWGGFIHAATPDERVTELRPRPPLELAGQLHCPLMAAVGAEDHNPSPEIGERLRDALAQSPHETRVDVYEGAGHAFFADYRPSYRAGPAALLWEQVVPFLACHLQDAG
ncbi:MAG: dienelactone hydrolase family protein [Solirubrobacteraceae bacterium]